MRALTALLAVFACLSVASATETYKVINRRPSSLLANLVGATGPTARVYEITSGSAPLISPGVSLKADDAKSTISIEGREDRAKEMARVLAQFDIMPRHVIAHVVISSKADKYQTKCDVEIANNSPWALDDSVVGLKLKISPRINGDGTITGSFDVSTPEAHVSMVMRMANGKSQTFAFGEQGLIKDQSKKDTAGDVPPIEISVRFEIVGK